MEFFTSSFWNDNVSRILTTFGFSLAGTGVKAVSNTDPNITNNMNAMTLVDIFQIGSYCISILVGVTVIWRFVIFLIDKTKLDKLRRAKRNARI